MERIESASNAKIKLAASLHQRKERERRGEFVAEGVRLAETAALSGWPLSFCIVAEPALANDRVQGILDMLREKDCPVYLVPPNVYKKASATESPQGVLLVMKTVQSSLSNFSVGKNSMVVVLDRIQDPGNVGTVIRTANAFGIGSVVLTGDCADLYNPKTVRATMGAVFRQRVRETGLDGLKAMKDSGIRILGAALGESSRDIREVSLKNTAVAVGSEGSGLSEELLSLCDERIIIPMAPECESLNAAVAASVIMWEMSGKTLRT